MSKKMLIDAAHPEEVRVAVLSKNKIEDFDFESQARKPLRGNIFLARVTRVEPSLQAAFVDYGGNRHGFLAFSEIHPDYYQIPVSDRKLLQESEQEVAELAAKLELSQRGDDEDGDEDDDTSAASDDAAEEDDANTDADIDDDADEEEPVEASSEDETNDAASDEPDASDDDEQPVERRVEEEEEEEHDGEDDDVDAEKPGDDETESSEADDETLEAASEDESDDEDAPDDGAAVAEAEQNDEKAEQEDDSADTAPAAEASDEDADDSGDNDDGDDENDDDAKAEKKAAKSARKAREELFEQYKSAKRRRAQLLRNYKIQEVIKRRQILLIQVVKEERGNKGAALTTYLSLAGRYCVLMPNTARGGGISRKIANGSDRRRLRRVVDSLDVPQGMGLIIRTAGAKRTKTEIKRDYDYLLRLWENIRSLTLKSIAPCLIYEEASLIKRAIRDLYDKDISKVYVEGEDGYREAKDFMKMLMPSHAKNVQPYKERTPIFLKNGVETQLDGMYQPTVRLKSGGYLVIHQTEALVAIDVNSGRATRERNIEQTALKTNIEAAEEAARQFRLRDLAGLIVIDFIDMEEPRNNRKVERALKDAMKADRARVQVGRISSFGLLEMSRQRRRSGIVDGTTQTCPTCSGAGVIRSHEMAALRILRAIEGEAISGKVGIIAARASIDVSLHVLNHNRDWLNRIETLNGVSIEIVADSDKHGDDYSLESSGVPRERPADAPVIRADQTDPIEIEEAEDEDRAEQQADAEEKPKRRRRRRRSRRDRDEADAVETSEDETETESKEASEDNAEEKPKKRRRRGRRGGRRSRRDSAETEAATDANGDAEGGADENGDAQPFDATDDGETKPVTASEETIDDAPAERDEQPVIEPETEKGASAQTDSEDAPASANGAAPSDAEIPAVKSTEMEDTPAEANNDEQDETPPAPRKPARRGWWRRSAS